MENNDNNDDENQQQNQSSASLDNSIQQSQRTEENNENLQNIQNIQNQKETENKEQEFSIWSLQHIISIQRKIRQHKRITIDLTKCQYEVVRNVAADSFAWNIIDDNQENNKDWNIQWCDTYIDEVELRKMLPYQKINRFPGSYNLGRKNFLARNLSKMKKFFPEEYNFYPKTWLLPYQQEELRQYVIKNNYQKILIVKPENQSQGKGIFLTRKIEGIEFGEHFVVQEYLNNPYLLEGLKFDLRIYVLLKSVCPLKIFIYKEGLGRFSTVKYEKVTKQNINEKCMHLTNYAINKMNPNFIFNENQSKDNIGHKKSLTSVLKMLQDSKKDVKKLWSEIQQIVVSTLISCNPYLSHTYKSCQPKEENNEMAFELFGFDIIIDENFKPWLLEVNHTPSFAIDTPLDNHIKSCLILDTLILENLTWKARKKYYDSRNNINPSIKGLVINKMTKEEIQEQKTKIDNWENNNLGAYEKIYPTNDPILQEKYNQFLLSAQDQYDEWSGAKICRVTKKDTKKEPLINQQQKNKQVKQQSTEPQSPKQKKTQNKILISSKGLTKENMAHINNINNNLQENNLTNLKNENNLNESEEQLAQYEQDLKLSSIPLNQIQQNRIQDKSADNFRKKLYKKNSINGGLEKTYQKYQIENYTPNAVININNLNLQFEHQIQQELEYQQQIQNSTSNISNINNMSQTNSFQNQSQVKSKQNIEQLQNRINQRSNPQDNNDITLPLVKQSNYQSNVAIVGIISKEKYLQQMSKNQLKAQNPIQNKQLLLQQQQGDTGNGKYTSSSGHQMLQSDEINNLNQQILSQQISCPQLIISKTKMADKHIYKNSNFNKNNFQGDLIQGYGIGMPNKIFSKLVYSSNNNFQQQTPNRMSIPIRSYNFQKNLPQQFYRNE